MKTILVPLFKLNKYSKNPEKINHNLFKFYLDRDMDIYPEKNNVLSTGFYSMHIMFHIIPAADFSKYSCIANSNILKDAEISLNLYCYKPIPKDKYFAPRFDNIQKNTCILYLNIVSSSNEEDYIFNIIDR